MGGNVKIQYSTNGGSSWSPVKSSTPDDGSYSWTIPDTPTTQARVKITYLGYTSNYDISDANFTIRRELGCPYVYVWNGNEFVEENTILPASEGNSGIFTDFYKIENHLELKDDKYAIEIREFEQEHTYLDKIELLAADHPARINVGTTPDEEILAYKEILMPVSCIDNYGNNQLPLVENIGNGHFEGEDGNWLTVNFGQVGSGDKVVILAKPPPKEASVAAQVNDGSDWKTIGTVYSRGKGSVHLVRIPKLGSRDSLRVRLLCKGNARIDYVALANLAIGAMKINECALALAWHSTSGNVIHKLGRVDLDYAELVPGDTIRLEFTSPTQTHGWQRDFVLVSTGYYEHIESISGPMSARNVKLSPTFKLSGYPNPFKSEIEISFALPKEVDVSLKIYDITGKLIENLVNKITASGYYSVNWDAKDLPSGIYFVKFQASEFAETRKLVLMK